MVSFSHIHSKSYAELCAGNSFFLFSFEFLYSQAGQKTHKNKEGTMDHNKRAVYCFTF